MTSCWLFGHKWEFLKEHKTFHDVLGNLSADPRYARAEFLERETVWECKYCPLKNVTKGGIVPDNRRRENWERLSNVLKGILK